ncbi:MAG: hypothetical protein AB1486_16985 [Planctomycetota bacterium]
MIDGGWWGFRVVAETGLDLGTKHLGRGRRSPEFLGRYLGPPMAQPFPHPHATSDVTPSSDHPPDSHRSRRYA